MFDTARFIQCVEKTPVIWEKGTEAYCDRGLREENWYSVGRCMFDKWTKMTEDEKQEIVKQMKNKWRHIRDNYSKFIKQGRGRKSTYKRKSYLYADALSFLIPTVDKSARPSKNKLDEEETENSTHEDEDEAKNQEESVQRQEVTQTFKKQRTRRSSFTPFQRSILDKMETSTASTTKTAEEDADKCFLLSLLPDLKKLNDEQKLDFRLYTLQFFRDIRQKSTP